MYQMRTDLALEAREKFEQDNVEIKGVRLEKEQISPELFLTKLVIETENGAKVMGKPKGKYYTLEAPNLLDLGEVEAKQIAVHVSRVIRDILPDLSENASILVAGLGNREVTPDSLGPNVVDQMVITRHLIQEFGDYIFCFEHNRKISGIIPGVMAQTGMETEEIIRGVIQETHPDCLVVIDALAARSTKRLNRTIQITDAGIHPGSGVGNNRNAINQKSMGIPVVAIGIPTVVDAASIVTDAMSEMIQAMADSDYLRQLGCSLDTLDDYEKQELIRDMISPQLNAFYVTPKDIDEAIGQISSIVSEAINLSILGNEA